MFFFARQGFGNSTPPSPAEESGTDEKLTLFNQTPPPLKHTLSFWMSVFFFCASERSQAQRGKREL